MRKNIRIMLIIIGWCVTFVWLLVASINEDVLNILAIVGAITISTIAIWLLKIFIGWLAQPDDEKEEIEES